MSAVVESLKKRGAIYDSLGVKPMVGETCELCGYQSQLGAVEKHHIIPNEVTEQAGIPKSQTVRMCCNCRRELDTWYSGKVVKMIYGTSLLARNTKECEGISPFLHA